jgi:hypothetical protein
MTMTLRTALLGLAALALLGARPAPADDKNLVLREAMPDEQARRHQILTAKHAR